MKVYLSVPMIANRTLERANLMAKAIRDAGHEVTSPWVLGSIEGHDPRILNIFARDMHGAESSDALVADVSQPSIGVGMEIMAAFKAGRKIVIVRKRGSVVSRMLLHMEGKEMVEFDDDRTLYLGLVSALKTC